MLTSKKVLLVAIPVVLLATVVGYINRTHVKSLFSSKNTAAPSTPASATNTPVDPSSINLTPSKPSENDHINDTKNGTPTPPPTSTALTATITNTRVVNAMAQVSVLVSGVQSGTCRLTLAKTGATSVEATTQIVNRSGIYTCEDFNIAVSRLNAGSWTAAVTLQNADHSATSDPAQALLQVSP